MLVTRSVVVFDLQLTQGQVVLDCFEITVLAEPRLKQVQEMMRASKRQKVANSLKILKFKLYFRFFT